MTAVRDSRWPGQPAPFVMLARWQLSEISTDEYVEYLRSIGAEEWELALLRTEAEEVGEA